MPRPLIKKTDATWKGLAWHLEQHEGFSCSSRTRDRTQDITASRARPSIGGRDYGYAEWRQLRAVLDKDVDGSIRPRAGPGNHLAGLAKLFLAAGELPVANPALAAPVFVPAMRLAMNGAVLTGFRVYGRPNRKLGP